MSPDDDPFCARCRHLKSKHTTEPIPKGQYGEGGFCTWMRDPMYSPTEECICAGFEESKTK